MMSESEFRDERVNFDEIVAALKGLSYEVRSQNAEYCARQIVEWVHANLREPEYIPGEIYQDAKGRRLIRVDNDPWPWKIISSGSVIDPSAIGYIDGWALEDWPERPLRRLVPEPGPDD